jgi:hypothetical protein
MVVIRHKINLPQHFVKAGVFAPRQNLSDLAGFRVRRPVSDVVEGSGQGRRLAKLAK